MKPRKTFLLRIEPGLYAELEAWAQQELRSVNGQIEYLLKQAVHRRKPAVPGPPDDEPHGAENAPH
jgi:hypothetical protein